MYADMAADLRWAVHTSPKREKVEVIEGPGFYARTASRSPVIPIALTNFVIHRVRRQLGYPSALYKAAMKVAREDQILKRADEIRAERKERENTINLDATDLTTSGPETGEAPMLLLPAPVVAKADEPAKVKVKASRPRKPRKRAEVAVPELSIPGIITSFVPRDLRSADEHYGLRTPVGQVADGSMPEAYVEIARYGTEQIGLVVRGSSDPVVVPLGHGEAHILAGDIAACADEVEYRLRLYGRRICR